MNSYTDKYNLTKEQSLFLAKKKWDENIYCGMQMENRAVTFPQTQTILSGANVPGVRLDDIQAILNMRDAWRRLIDTLELPITIDYICELNGLIARNEALEWGKLRTGSVGISGTEYLPPIPTKEKAESELLSCMTGAATQTEKAIDLFLWGTRAQLFWDGNKRTSMTAANKVLISSGAGMLTITNNHMEKFNALLLAYYDTGVKEELKRFLYDNCIQGLEI